MIGTTKNVWLDIQMIEYYFFFVEKTHLRQGWTKKVTHLPNSAKFKENGAKRYLRRSVDKLPININRLFSALRCITSSKSFEMF